MTSIVLWIYIVLLLAGGLAGFVKAKSKVSLFMALLFAALLALSLILAAPESVPTSLLALLVVVFGIRLAKTRKFIPSGLMLVLTAVTLTLVQVLK